MNQLTLTEIKQIEFNLLKKFKFFCKENNIQYFLSNGTLLGAIKYKGFIPWDDDIDVFVPREDYNKLVHCFENKGNYQLFSFERTQQFRYPYAKLCDMSTIKEETNIDNGVDLGIDIDIFPLDAWGSDLEVAKKANKRIRRHMRLLDLTKLIKADSVHPIKRFVKAVVMILCKVGGSKIFLKQIIKEARSESFSNSIYLGCKSWPIYGEREIISAEVFSEAVEVEFEGELFPAPVGYDQYLHSLYGDYRQDPPIDKQITHHKFIAYRR